MNSLVDPPKLQIIFDNSKLGIISFSVVARTLGLNVFEFPLQINITCGSEKIIEPGQDQILPLQLNYTVNDGLKYVSLENFIQFFKSDFGPACGVSGFELAKITFDTEDIYEDRLNIFSTQNEGKILQIDTNQGKLAAKSLYFSAFTVKN